MTPTFDPAQPGSSGGMFRPGDHILVVPQGSSIAILDLDRGVMYATTPLGAESWSMLVGNKRPSRRTVAEAQSGSDTDEDGREWARIAGYLLDRRIIGPATE